MASGIFSYNRVHKHMVVAHEPEFCRSNVYMIDEL